MKKLEELGISPAPWKLCRDGEIVNGIGYSLTDGDGCFVRKSDASLAVAAPEMYECLSDAIMHKCFFCKATEDERREQCDLCIVTDWKNALAKAAGEETK